MNIKDKYATMRQRNLEAYESAYTQTMDALTKSLANIGNYAAQRESIDNMPSLAYDTGNNYKSDSAKTFLEKLGLKAKGGKLIMIKK